MSFRSSSTLHSPLSTHEEEADIQGRVCNKSKRFRSAVCQCFVTGSRPIQSLKGSHCRELVAPQSCQIWAASCLELYFYRVVANNTLFGERELSLPRTLNNTVGSCICMDWEGRLPLSSNRSGPFVSALTQVVLQLGQRPIACKSSALMIVMPLCHFRCVAPFESKLCMPINPFP